ncbi:MAG: hypothetical protein JSV92_02375 [archaeon]|nr:MAG: hypothetical protein JSV92_02375 [archaeon]
MFKLPKYVEKTITSPTAKSGNYGLLSENQWRDLANHIYNDEKELNRRGKTYLPRGNMNAHRKHGKKSVLDGLLYDAVVMHGGITFFGDFIPNHEEVGFLFKANEMGVKIAR